MPIGDVTDQAKQDAVRLQRLRRGLTDLIEDGVINVAHLIDSGGELVERFLTGAWVAAGIERDRIGHVAGLNQTAKLRVDGQELLEGDARLFERLSFAGEGDVGNQRDDALDLR